jgi:hypothetical protein
LLVVAFIEVSSLQYGYRRLDKPSPVAMKSATIPFRRPAFYFKRYPEHPTQRQRNDRAHGPNSGQRFDAWYGSR